jgi:hypothetical protein
MMQESSLRAHNFLYAQMCIHASSSLSLFHSLQEASMLVSATMGNEPDTLQSPG